MLRATRVLGFLLAYLHLCTLFAAPIDEILPSEDSKNETKIIFLSMNFTSTETIQSVTPTTLTNSTATTTIESTSTLDGEDTTVSLDHTMLQLSHQTETTPSTVEQHHSSSISPTVETVLNSDDAIRHLPGYWIKRPGDTEGGGETDVHEGEASFIDYRTEIYQISDLFATEIPPPLEHQYQEQRTEEDVAAPSRAATQICSNTELISAAGTV